MRSSLAAAFVFTALFLPAQAQAYHPTVQFAAPSGGADLSGRLAESSCAVSASSDTAGVDFYLDGRLATHNDFAPWNCYFDSRAVSNGAHALKAVARDGGWNTGTAEVQIYVQNPSASTYHPNVLFKAPLGGAHISGVIDEGPACEVSASSDAVAVDFYLDGKLITRNNHAPWNCYFDARSLTAGEHELKAVARDSAQNSSYAKVWFHASGTGAGVDPGAGTGGDSGAGDGVSGAKATTRPVGSGPLSDSEAASRVNRHEREIRPTNYGANHRRPTSSELATFRATHTLGIPRLEHVTGSFTGTTDEIIQWAAHKWGIAEDLLRAVAATESWWDQRTVGDGPTRGGYSYGLYQIKNKDGRGAYPLSKISTAFNADYQAAVFRYYYDGKATWLNDSCCHTGTTYRSGDMWGGVGVHFSGRWHDTAADRYVARVKSNFERRVWEQSDFIYY